MPGAPECRIEPADRPHEHEQSMPEQELVMDLPKYLLQQHHNITQRRQGLQING